MNQKTAVLVLAAMRSELKPVVKKLKLKQAAVDKPWDYSGEKGSLEITAAVTLMGLESAQEVTEDILEEKNFDYVFLVGVAGAQSPSLDIGELVIPVEVMDARNETSYPVENFDLRPMAGILFSTDHLNYTPEYRAMLDSKNVLAVDMEAGAIAAVCQQRGVPFTVIKAISDRIDAHSEPYDVFDIANPDGSPNFKSVVSYLLKNPHKIIYLMQLGRGAQKAINRSCTELYRLLENLTSP
jgi:nucleoside phosphorylase